MPRYPKFASKGVLLSRTVLKKKKKRERINTVIIVLLKDRFVIHLSFNYVQSVERQLLGLCYSESRIYSWNVQ